MDEFFQKRTKKACHNDKDISGDDSSAEVQSTTKITDFLVVDKSSVILVKRSKIRLSTSLGSC